MTQRSNCQLRCVIAGLGRIGSTLQKDSLREKPATHAEAIADNPHTILTAGADPSKKHRREFQADWNSVQIYDDAEEMVRNENPDILHIASWTDTHPKLLEMGFHYRIPVIVCEKPLANSIADIRPVMEMAKSESTRVVVNHERRFSRDYQSIRKIINSNALGELLSLNSRLYMGGNKPSRKTIYHDGTHMIDIVRFLCDADIDIQQALGNPEKPGGKLLVIGSIGKTDITIDISGSRDHLVFELDLSFTSGRVRIGNGTYEIWKSEESPYYSGFRSLVREKGEWNCATGYFSGMMNHVVSLSLNPRQKSKSSLKDGYMALKTIEQILKLAECSEIPTERSTSL
ncbi:hypothetical protein S1OALGB6SA_2400 [Olavius algarvensis spirochete endosymbiont]|uniref:Gfo/Idh/MocA family protein n=1 Tax=Olavius algarvensis spirochete endosymbiont TaxID=260710 RepID=UPI00068E691A|nr:Gfo/Idh/MocA family oxidoreductase [Olavius algarvensis spirochete endosymbiont]VDB01298.1 hypothetical protein S1OALGB6SA_2400 [Olavius algarvensis spirochete endosymbiont]